jgi:prevent-host-death family protein
MASISHRDMRNSSAEILRQVAAGKSYTITNNGAPVARLVPFSGAAPDLPAARAAVRRGGFAGLRRHVVTRSTVAEVLDDLRGDR